MLPKTQSKAPAFSLSDQNGGMRALKDFFGQWVVLYFYPKDDTPGCTKEACSFRDGFSRFKREGVVVLGISADSVKKHAKFVEKYELPFLLLADEQKTVVEQYGVWAKKKFMGREYMGILRTTFLINPLGNIVKVYENVKPDEHADEVLKEISRMKNEKRGKEEGI
ncbi:MAG: thioredoxin-dependent peroxiredoxin [Patescibacteria group bacterium]|nr:thioredoxin-dependent peroxiredoxin [Patescibacteria group bacterium]